MSSPCSILSRTCTVLLFLFLAVFTSARVVPEYKKDPRILIVGAGVSGIAAASRLIENGFTNLKILEAENRIGGRVYAVKSGNWTIDIGGHWVHGEAGNEVYELAAPLGLVTNVTTDYQNEILVFSDNTIANTSVFDSFKREYVFSTEDLSNRNDSKNSYFRELFGKTFKQLFKTQDRIDGVFNWLDKAECTADGCDSLDDVSAKGSLEFEKPVGNDLTSWNGRGMATIIDLLLKRHEKSQGPPIEIEKYLEMNKEVTSISKQDGAIEVKCADGSTYIGDIVIVTVSLAVLKKRHDTMFRPQLPEQKRRAIEGLGIGTVDKIILRFEDIWWDRNITGYNIVWLQKDKLLEEGQFPWELEILSYNTEDGSPYTLTAWMVGEGARSMETSSVEDAKKGAMRILRKFLSHLYPNIPEPVDVLRSTWGTNPHFGGVYSYRSLKSEELNVSAADLTRPVTDNNGKQVILFAGEATSSHKYGTVHGALETGWREADRIITMFK